ncbi:MAG: restriction endonuclease subunit S [Moraxellaceae bacterium]|nr:restriction endonuclease subunit S [Pseudomonadales bacterium]MCP5177601.1 restriction endonuclease subunit S [Moraxellaceae bacterium]
MSNVPVGYKQTDVGVIPEDWELKSLRDICWVNQGLQISIQNRLKTSSLNTKLYITIQFLNDGKKAEYIDTYSQSVCCDENDILMTRTGNTGIVISGVNGVFHNNFFKINYDKKQVTKDFFIYYLSLNKTQKLILDKAGTSTIPDLNHNDFYAIPIPLPPTLTEQTAIATALSDVDALLNQLDKLIAKKRDIKQATMQQLLTGKKRLAGFGDGKGYKQTEVGEIPEDWILRAIGDVVSFSGGAQPPRSTFIFTPREGYIRLIQIRDYKSDNYETYIPVQFARKTCTKDEIMIGRYGPPIFQILSGIEGAYNVALIKATPSNALNNKYLY